MCFVSTEMPAEKGSCRVILMVVPSIRFLSLKARLLSMNFHMPEQRGKSICSGNIQVGDSPTFKGVGLI